MAEPVALENGRSGDTPLARVKRAVLVGGTSRAFRRAASESVFLISETQAKCGDGRPRRRRTMRSSWAFGFGDGREQRSLALVEPWSRILSGSGGGGAGRIFREYSPERYIDCIC